MDKGADGRSLSNVSNTDNDNNSLPAAPNEEEEILTWTVEQPQADTSGVTPVRGKKRRALFTAED